MFSVSLDHWLIALIELSFRLTSCNRSFHFLRTSTHTNVSGQVPLVLSKHTKLRSSRKSSRYFFFQRKSIPQSEPQYPMKRAPVTIADKRSDECQAVLHSRAINCCSHLRAPPTKSLQGAKLYLLHCSAIILGALWASAITAMYSAAISDST